MAGPSYETSNFSREEEGMDVSPSRLFRAEDASPGILQQLERLGAARSELRDAVGHLEERISPILRMSDEGATGMKEGGSDQVSMDSALFTRIADEAVAVQSLTRRVERIAKQVQL